MTTGSGKAVSDSPDRPSFRTGVVAITVCVIALAASLFLCGLGGVSHGTPFKVNTANFALFAGFFVVAAAIERFIEPFSPALPCMKPDRALYAFSIALVLGVIVSAVFGLYFMEAIGVQIAQPVPRNGVTTTMLTSSGQKIVRGLDIFITALVIAGGTKPLHDLITAIQKAGG
jgi:membrane protease YdiL (CAAX protease family)